MKSGASKTTENSDETWEKGEKGKRSRHINKERTVIKALQRTYPTALSFECAMSCCLKNVLFPSNCAIHREEYSKREITELVQLPSLQEVKMWNTSSETQQCANQYQPRFLCDHNNYHHQPQEFHVVWALAEGQEQPGGI